MNVRWLVFDYVDPALDIDARERRRIRRAAWNRLRQSPPADPHGLVPRWVRIVAPLMPALGMLIALVPFFMMRTKSWWHIGWAVALQSVVTWLLLAIVARWTWRPAVWMALRDAGHHVCIRCGYWLRGLRDDVNKCPECGEPRKAMAAGSPPGRAAG